MSTTPKNNLQIQSNHNKKNLKEFFTDVEIKISSFKQKYKICRRVKIILNNKRTAGFVTIPDLNVPYKLNSANTMVFPQKRDISQNIKIENPDISPQTYEHLIFVRKPKIQTGKKDNIFSK